jgi:branched-chain amino acid transport system substrate-binding protein
MTGSASHIRRIVLAVLLALPAVLTGAVAQEEFSFNSAAEKSFLGATLLFKNGKFGEAAPLFDDLHRIKPWHQRTTASYVMLAKAWFELKKYEQSALLLQEFFGMFPSSTYRDDAYYTLAVDHLMLAKFDDAAGEFLHALELANDRALAQRAATLFEYVAEDRLTLQGLERILRLPFLESSKDLVRLKLAEKYAAGDDPSRAKQIVYDLVTAEKGNPYRERARELLDRLERRAGVKIAVVLPLMEELGAGPVKNLAGELLEGISFAVKERASHLGSGTAVSIEVRDTKRDSAIALRAVREAASSPDVIGIIGPVFSNDVAACAPVAQSSGIPMISPTATADGLAALGLHLFQLHPDWSTRGKAMARYAVSQLGMTMLAVLTSSEAPESLSARSFAEEAQRLGATVVDVESFPRGASDLRDQFMRIRKASLPADSLHPPAAGADTISGNTDITVSAIQGIFLAVDNAEEIGVIGSQLSYFNIKTQILGNDEWYDPAQLDIHKQYVNGAVFTSDYFADPRDTAYARFEGDFLSGTGRHPTKYTLIGYDAMRLLLGRVEEGATTREKLTASLARLERFPAIHSTVTFTHGRVNSDVHILQYHNGEVKRVIDIPVN